MAYSLFYASISIMIYTSYFLSTKNHFLFCSHSECRIVPSTQQRLLTICLVDLLHKRRTKKTTILVLRSIINRKTFKLSYSQSWILQMKCPQHYHQFSFHKFKATGQNCFSFIYSHLQICWKNCQRQFKKEGGNSLVRLWIKFSSFMWSLLLKRSPKLGPMSQA